MFLVQGLGLGLGRWGWGGYYYYCDLKNTVKIQSALLTEEFWLKTLTLCDPISLTWCSCPGLGHSQYYTWTSPSVTSPWSGSEPGRCPELPLRARLKRRRQTQKWTYLLLNVSPFTHLLTMINSIQLFHFPVSWDRPPAEWRRFEPMGLKCAFGRPMVFRSDSSALNEEAPSLNCKAGTWLRPGNKYIVICLQGIG